MNSPESRTFVVRHPAFGAVTFVFDGDDASSGCASTEGFSYLGQQYPEFNFSFQRDLRGFAASRLNDITKQSVDGNLRAISEIAPPAFRSFVLSKAKELAEELTATAKS